MTGVASGSAPQSHDAIRSLLRAGMNDQAIVRLCTRPDDPVARELLFDAFFQNRDWLPALALAEGLTHGQPDNPRLQKALIATLCASVRNYRPTFVIDQHGVMLYTDRPAPGAPGRDIPPLAALNPAAQPGLISPIE